MRLSSYTDYALRALIFLALKREGELSTIAEIAQTYAISKNHLMKIINQLTQDGYVESVRGRSGGIRLARPAAEISIGAVVRRTEQDMDIVECFDGTAASPCRLAPACVLKGALREALEAFLSVLDDYSLADIVKARRSVAALLDIDWSPLPRQP